MGNRDFKDCLDWLQFLFVFYIPFKVSIVLIFQRVYLDKHNYVGSKSLIV